MMNKNTSTKRIVSLVLAIVMVAAMLTVSAVADNTKIYVNGELIQNGETVSADKVTVKIDPVATDDVVTVNGEEVKLDENGEFVIYAATPDAAETTDTPDAAETTDTPDAPVVAQGTVVIEVKSADGSVVSVTFTLEPAAEETADTADSADEADTKDTADETETDDTADEPVDTDDTADEPVDTDDTADEPVDTDDTADEPATDDEPIDTDDTADQPETKKVLNGDVDNDGVITSNDALLILMYSVGSYDFDKVQLQQGDVTGTGVYSDDALAVLRASVDIEPITPEYIEVVL